MQHANPLVCSISLFGLFLSCCLVLPSLSRVRSPLQTGPSAHHFPHAIIVEITRFASHVFCLCLYLCLCLPCALVLLRSRTLADLRSWQVHPSLGVMSSAVP